MVKINTLSNTEISQLPIDQVAHLAERGDVRAQRIVKFGLIADCNKKERDELKLLEEVWG